MNRTKNRKHNRFIKDVKPIHKKILYLISEGKIASKIAKETQKSNSTISEHINNLIFSGFINEEINSSIKIYKLTNKGLDYLSAFLKGYDIKPNWYMLDRAHNIVLKAKIIRNCDSNFEDWKKHNLNNWTKYYKNYDGVIVSKTPKNFLFQLPKAYYKNRDEVFLYAGMILSQICDLLEEEYPLLKIDRKFKILSQSHALVGDPVAQIAKKNNVVLQGGRIEIDASQFPEIEFVDKYYSSDDFESYVNFTTSVLDNKISPDIVNNQNIIFLRERLFKLEEKLK
jgi:DNA-binding MarR family transcriptional regulator